MALDGDRLGNLIGTEFGALTDVQKANSAELYRALGRAIVAEIAANGEVAVTIDDVNGSPATGGGTGSIT